MSVSAPARSYLICGTPRTGSTLLCGLLAATRIAGKPQSYFRLPDEPAYAENWGVAPGLDGPLDYQEYVRAAMRAGRTANGVFAARVMWGTLEEVIGKLRTAYHDPISSDVEILQRELGPTRFVHLQRRDVLAQAVSWAKAEQTGHWHDGDSVAPQATIRFDVKQIDRLVVMINEHNAAWRDWFHASATRPLVVHYEDLVADVVRVLDGILQFLRLELPPGHVVEPCTRKQGDQMNRDWLERYRAIRGPVL